MRRYLSVLIALAVPTLGLAAPRITGYEVVADRPVLEQVRQLELEGSVGHALTRSRIRSDIRRIQLLGTVARVHVGTRDHGGGKKVLYKVDANPVIGRIVLEGVTAVPAREIFAAFHTKPGQVLDYRKLYRDLNKVPEVYARHGLLWADVMGPSDVRVKGGEVRIRVREFKLGRVVIRGIDGGLREMVRGSIQLRPGQMVPRSKLLSSLHAIYQTSFIRDVRWKPLFDKERTRVTLVLDIEGEGSTRASVG